MKRNLLIGEGALVARLRSAHPNAVVHCVSSFNEAGSRDPSAVVNATPTGMKEWPGMAIDPVCLAHSACAAGIVCILRAKAFLRAARTHQLRTIAGSRMTVFQAANAFQLLTGKIASTSQMMTTFEQLIPACQEQTV